MKSDKRVLFVEPFWGGSHRLFAERVAALSSHRVRLLTLPARFWKWRMRGAHLKLAAEIKTLATETDCLIVSDILSLGELVGLVPELASMPKIVYFHENQLTYPVPEGEAPDVHFGFTNLSTALAAEAVVFNSRFHLEEFLDGINPFLKAMPDQRPKGIAKTLRDKASVVYPGVDCRELDRFRPGKADLRPPTILWNHRWEFDKCPDIFFRVLKELADEGLEFKVHVVGENFQAKPAPFIDAKENLGDRIGQFGFVPSREKYVQVLWDSDVVVSTAIQEFFGISVMEAAYCGCFPLVPDRLVYPELYPSECVYKNDDDLKSRLRALIEGRRPGQGWGESFRDRIKETWDVEVSVRRLDDLVGRLTEKTGGGGK